MRSIYCLFVFRHLIAILAGTSSSPPLVTDDVADTVAKKLDPKMTKHVLWRQPHPRPDKAAYASWYKSYDLAWVSEHQLPRVDAGSKVDLFFVTKPIFGLIGSFTDIWHGGLGFRVENGPSFLYEYTSINFMAAVAYPEKKWDNTSTLLHFPSLAVVDYQIDLSGETFPVTGGEWRETHAIGTTTGEGLNTFAKWAFRYGVEHSRYLVWRALENGTEKSLVDSAQCFDFVIDGLRQLQTTRDTAITATDLTRTIVNVYVSAVEMLPFNESVSNFFASERLVLQEWLELTGELPHLRKHSSEWYWPAWFSTTLYAGGTGQLLQDTDYPDTYQKYVLSWPQSFKSKATTLGVQRTSVPIFANDGLIIAV